jgi:type VI secretion system protein ImpL
MSSWHISQIKYAFGVSTLFSFYGVVTYVVWMFGDRFGYDLTYRVTIIALILLTLPFTLVAGFVAARRQKKSEKQKEEEAKAVTEKEAAAPSKAAAPAGSYEDLTKSAEELVQFLKSSNLAAKDKDAIYSLPWYLVMGTPKSGKSSLVLGSDLNFQTLPSQRQSEQKFIRPTRSVDWRVTNDAVFLDTAGRYQTEGADEDEWTALLETIKKYRGKRPLDGLLLTVSTERILHADERSVEESAKVLRARLDDARQRLNVKFPVYLIFTHADAIEGFRDSFSQSKQEGKNLVWGATIPLEKTENAQSLFDGEYELLQDSVMQRRLMRLSAPFPPVRQLRIFNFPLHFGAARRKLGAFVSTLFRPNPFSESPFLRGFYFTAVPVNRPKIDGNQTLTNMRQTVGQTFFTERFFRDVLLRDKDLVRTLQQQRQKPPIWGWIFTALGAFLVAALLGLVALSLYNNKVLLDEASEKGKAVLDIYKADANSKTSPLEKDEERTRQEIKALDNLRSFMVKLDQYEREGAPWTMRFGLYSGDKIYRDRLLPIYFNAVEQRFKRPVVIKLEDDLKKFTSTQVTGAPDQQDEVLGANYDLLKAYLMLSAEHKQRAESTAVINALKQHWAVESKVPADLTEVALEQLNFYAQQVDREQFPPIRVDEKLVETARQKLRSYPAVNRYYKRKVTEISKQIETEIGVMTAERILATNSGDTRFIEGSYTVPGAYTLEGNQLMKTAISEAGAKLSEDDWVMGEVGKADISQTSDTATLETRYYRDYADQWRAFVKGLNIRPYDKESAEQALFAFSSANSPLEILLKEVARQTNLSAKPQTQGWWDWITSRFRSAQKKETGGNTAVEKEFRPLFEFVGEEGKTNAPVERYRGQISEVAKKYSTFSPGQLEEISRNFDGNNSQFPQLAKAESSIKSMLGAFNQTPSGQEVADFLQKPLGNLQILLGADAQSQLAKTWTDKLLPMAKNLEKGYPFETAESEADLKNLRTFLKPKTGELSKFFDERLKNYFETAEGRLKVKESSEVEFSDEFVSYLNNAFRLQRALYGDSGATEKFEYDFRLNPVKDAIIEITIDGQQIKSEETASAKLVFPAASGQTGVLMKFASTGGATLTTPSAPPANSSANSANSNVNAVRNTVQTNNDSSTTQKIWQGNWGLFRFFDAGSPAKQPGGEWLLTYTLGGKTVTATVKPSGEDLFDKNIFRSVRAPAKMLK